MPASRAELSSIETTLAELTERVGQLADGAVPDDEVLAHGLMELERALRVATRQVRSLVDRF